MNRYGKSGNDTMRGGAGNDTYFVHDQGDIIIELAGQGVDTVLLYPDSWQFTTFTAPAEVENLDASGHWSGMALTGNALANTLRGNAKADTLDGQAGNDILIGGAGADTYVFGRGWGLDTVQENDSTANVVDKVLFGTGIAKADTTFQREGNHLAVSIVGSTDKLVIENWYMGTQHQVELFQYANGDTTTHTQVAGLVTAMAAFCPEAAAWTASAATSRTGQWRQIDLATAAV